MQNQFPAKCRLIVKRCVQEPLFWTDNPGTSQEQFNHISPAAAPSQPTSQGPLYDTITRFTWSYKIQCTPLTRQLPKTEPPTDTLQPHPCPAPFLRINQSRTVTVSVPTRFNLVVKLTDTPVKVFVSTIKLPTFCLPQVLLTLAQNRNYICSWMTSSPTVSPILLTRTNRSFICIRLFCLP